MIFLPKWSRRLAFEDGFGEQIALQQASPRKSARAHQGRIAQAVTAMRRPIPMKDDLALAVVSRVTLQTSSIGRCCRCDGEMHSSVAASYRPGDRGD